jgi:PPOX class probable F420-dependent enzyme
MQISDIDLAQLRAARYALLRTYRRDGAAVDTPIWFDIQTGAVVFRTKRGPKTKRLSADPRVELTACDHLGKKLSGATTFTGTASILSGDQAAAANRALHRRYGWQWNIIPMIKIPGVPNVHRDLPLREKLRRARDRNVWPDSAIVRIDLRAPAAS